MEPLLPREELPTLGWHNTANALAAALTLPACMATTAPEVARFDGSRVTLHAPAAPTPTRATDDTAAVCAEHSVICVRHPYSMGNGAAIKTGETTKLQADYSAVDMSALGYTHRFTLSVTY